MINCAQCGTPNRDGSKFCSNCGARLAPPSGLLCPMCGAPNTVESVFCAKCGARLVPLTAAPPEPPPSAPPIKGLSLPTKPAASAKPEPPRAEEEPTADWLARLRAAAPAPEEPPAPAPPVPARAAEEPTLDWLARLRAATATEEPAAPAEEQTVTESAPEEHVEIPEWLTRLRAAAPVSEEAPPTELRPPSAMPALEVEDIPDWLKPSAPRPGKVAPGVPAEPAIGPVTEQPSWLKAVEETPALPTGAPTFVAEESVPDWLRTVQPAPPTPAAPPAAVVEEIEPSEAPRAPVEVTAPAAPAEEPVEIPIAARAPGEPIPFAEEEIPDWLRYAKPAEKIEPIVETPAIQPALPEEVPAWIAALKPAAAIAPSPPAGVESAPVEVEGRLAGLRNVLPLAVALAEPRPPSEPSGVTHAREGTRVFESILAAPAAETATPVVKPKPHAWSVRPWVYALLMLAVVIPFFIPFDWAGATLHISGTPAAEFYDKLQALPANSTVVLAFEYDPSLAGEMDLQARAVVRHLMQRRVNLIALSTLETGPQIAQRILGTTAREVGGYDYGAHYVNLGYVAGHEAGLAQLAASGFSANAKDYVQQQPFGNFQIAQDVNDLRSVALVVVFAGTEEPLKMWLEQVQSRARVPMAAGVSAAVEPKARAYRDANQLAAMVSGLVGAAQYEVLATQPGLAVISVNAQSAAQLVLVFIIILGNIVFWMSRARGKAQ